MKLVIVESPAKAKTIEGYLGDSYKVRSSIGHIMHLSKSGTFHLGIDLDTFEPKYSVKKDHLKLVNELKKEADESTHVFLATDKDREGETISYHLMNKLNIKDKCSRVTFNEITKDAILHSVQNPQTINMDMVHSQQARRMLDRIVGFRLSNLLRKKIFAPSAGRVQSVVLKLIVDKEKEIEKFVPKEFWKINVEFSDGVIAELQKHNGKNIEIKTEKEAIFVVDDFKNEYKIDKINEKIIHRSPPLPFITSTLQQTAHNRLGFTSRKTMGIAQKLYEGITINKSHNGLITYMRTDSTRISNTFSAKVKKYILDTYGKEYLGGDIRPQKKKSNIQDAHEAVRPTNIKNNPEKLKQYLSVPEYKLYKLIFERTIASFMSKNKITTKRYEIKNNSYLFSCHSSKLKFKGFSVVYHFEEKEHNTFNSEIENLTEGQVLKNKKINKVQLFSNPPSRYTEAGLIKILESEGIGRPSTYSLIINTLIGRNYVKVVSKSFYAIRLGKLVIEILEKYFSDLINTDFTKDMENTLDEISQGTVNYKSYIKNFYNFFEPVIENLLEIIPVTKIKIEPKCPQCSGDLIFMYGRFGEFIGCDRYPECDYSRKFYPYGFIPEVIENSVCPKCGQNLITRFNSRREEVFIGCTMFFRCNFVESLDEQPDFIKKIKNKKKTENKPETQN